MCYLLGLIFIFAAIISLGKLDFNQFIMLCAISVGFNIAGALEQIAQSIKNDNNKEEKIEE